MWRNNAAAEQNTTPQRCVGIRERKTWKDQSSFWCREKALWTQDKIVLKRARQSFEMESWCVHMWFWSCNCSIIWLHILISYMTFLPFRLLMRRLLLLDFENKHTDSGRKMRNRQPMAGFMPTIYIWLIRLHPWPKNAILAQLFCFQDANRWNSKD